MPEYPVSVMLAGIGYSALEYEAEVEGESKLPIKER